MKTQLIEDFNESGSAPAGPARPAAVPAAPAPPASPAVASSEPSAAPVTEPATEPATEPRPAVGHRPQQASVQAARFAPQPPGFVSAHGGETTVPDLAAPLNARLKERPRDTTDVNGDPEWLAALLARDAEELSESQSSSRWTRRLLTWGTATVVPVLLAAGGLWLYQESRVEGALVVVANTSPAPATPAARPSVARTSPALPASPDVAAAGAPVAPVAAATPAPAARLTAERPDAAPSNAAPDKQAQQAETIPQPSLKRARVRKHPKAEARAEVPADSEPSASRRKEETLLQCRAHGYDDRQCVRRGCEMTRYGFACKG